MQAREPCDDGPSGSRMNPFPWSLGEVEALTSRGELSPLTVGATAAGAIQAREADLRAWN